MMCTMLAINFIPLLIISTNCSPILVIYNLRDIISLFKTFCSPYYGSCLWYYNSTGFESTVLNGIKESGKFLDCHLIHRDGYWIP